MPAPALFAAFDSLVQGQRLRVFSAFFARCRDGDVYRVSGALLEHPFDLPRRELLGTAREQEIAG